MRILSVIVAVLFGASCAARVPFEPLFVTGGVPPLVYHDAVPSVMVLHSAEQLLRSLRTHQQVLVHIDNGTRNDHNDSLALCAALARGWPRPLHVVSIHTNTHLFLARAVARTAGLTTSFAVPALLVFVDGKAVLPIIPATAARDELTAQVAQRIAHARASESHPSWIDAWWAQGGAWLQGLWGKMQRYLFGGQ